MLVPKLSASPALLVLEDRRSLRLEIDIGPDLVVDIGFRGRVGVFGPVQAVNDLVVFLVGERDVQLTLEFREQGVIPVGYSFFDVLFDHHRLLRLLWLLGFRCNDGLLERIVCQGHADRDLESLVDRTPVEGGRLDAGQGSENPSDLLLQFRVHGVDVKHLELSFPGDQENYLDLSPVIFPLNDGRDLEFLEEVLLQGIVETGVDALQ